MDFSSGSDAGEDGLHMAVLRVYLDADLDPSFAARLPAWLRIMTTLQAVQTIRQSAGGFRDRALRLAAAKLAAAAVAGRQDCVRYLEDLVGHETARELLVAPGSIPPGIDDVMRRTYDVLSERRCAGAPAKCPEPLTLGKLDAGTMTTTITSSAVGFGDFRGLSRHIDPRSWTQWPFWRKACKLLRIDGQFREDPHPPPLGQSWRGYFYEHMEWSWKGGIIAAFQNYLNVEFVVTPTRIDLDYSLYACRGSRLLSRVAQGGIDVDSGYCRAELVAPSRVEGAPDHGHELIRMDAQKRLRYTDLVSRSTPHQGAPGAGQALNYMCPAVLSLWMNELVYKSVADWTKASPGDRKTD